MGAAASTCLLQGGTFSTRWKGSSQTAEEPGRSTAVDRSHFEIQTSSGLRIASLDSGQLNIGRQEDMDIVVSDPTASELHAVVERHGGEWVLRDVGSTNGT